MTKNVSPVLAVPIKKINLWKRLVDSSVNYAKNICVDYASVFKDLVLEARLRPVKTIAVGSSLCVLYYAYKTNPSKHFLYERLTDLRQELILVPQSIQNKRALKLLEQYTQLTNKSCIDYYDFIFATIIVKRQYGKKCNLYVTQDPNLKKWFWEDLWENTIDVGAFGKFWNLDKEFKDYDIREEEFEI